MALNETKLEYISDKYNGNSLFQCPLWSKLYNVFFCLYHMLVLKEINLFLCYLRSPFANLTLNLILI